EVLNRRVGELEMRLGEQGRMLAERDYQLDRMRSELDAARTAEADLRGEVAASGSRSNTAVDRFRAEITELEAQLAAAIDERNKLRGEIGSMKRDKETKWGAGGVGGALVREGTHGVPA